MTMCPPLDASTPPPSTPDDLLETFLNLDTPPGYRAELIDREIIVVPPPSGYHESIIARITRAINRHAKVDVEVMANRGLITPRGRFIPDLTVVPFGVFEEQTSWAECTEVELVGEVTSTDPHHDRDIKRLGYAEAGIPLYLLVDRDHRETTLFSQPEGGDYRDVHTIAFGQKVALPEPFVLDLDTSEFP